MATRRRASWQKQRGTSQVSIIAASAIAWVGLTLVTYPTAAAWVSAYNQSLVVESYQEQLIDADPSASEQLESAASYNSALSSGAILAANANVPTGSGTLDDDELNYWKLLDAGNGIMGRVQIPSIGVDLPIYHGTSDEALLAGAGHLQGTSLPIGGDDTHSVITAHRGLANARMFTDLDQVKIGDTFSVTSFGRTVSYQVIDTRVVDPEDTASLRQEEGKDLVTLVTCTPLGVNSHRILVTGERVLPTPAADERRGEGPVQIQFPWWFVIYAGLTIGGIFGVWWMLLRRGGRRKPAPETATAGAAQKLDGGESQDDPAT